MTITGAEVEHAIADEQARVAQVVELLRARTALAVWPAHARTALLLALAEPDLDRSEEWKAATLRRHLFGPAHLPRFASLHAPTAAERRFAERLRSDVPACLPLRAGAYLVATSSMCDR